MKRKMLLTVIPALMVLAGCNPLSDYAAAGTKVNLFAEDTLAHEEIFGNSELGLKKPEPFRLNPVSSAAPAIAVQTARSGSGDNEKISIRFVAAVRITGTLSDATAVWTRTMYQNDGHVKEGKGEAEKASNKAYTIINDGGSELNISDFNSSLGLEGESAYTHFVTYTMLNIPIAGQNNASNHYLKVYLTVNDGGTTTSKVVATTVDQKTQLSYDFAKDKTGYFGLKKTVSAGVTSFASFDRSSETLGNYARFVNVSLNKDESFVLVNSASDYFAVHGYDKVHAADSSDTNFEQDGQSQFAKAKATASHYFYLSSGSGTENYIYRTDATKTKTYYLKPNSNWTENWAWFALYTHETSDKWYKMYDVGSGIYGCDVVYTNLNSLLFIFCRMDKDKQDNLSWDARWNQTGDLNDDNAYTNNLFTIPDGAWDGSTNGWSTR